MKSQWLEWLDWKDKEACDWAVQYILRRDIRASKPAASSNAADQLEQLLSSWPQRRRKSEHRPPHLASQLEFEHRMRNAYAQKQKRKAMKSFKTYNLWMSRKMHNRLHRLAIRLGLNIHSTIEHLVDQAHKETTAIDSTHQELKATIAEQRKRIEELEDNIRHLKRPTTKSAEQIAEELRQLPKYEPKDDERFC